MHRGGGEDQDHDPALDAVTDLLFDGNAVDDDDAEPVSPSRLQVMVIGKSLFSTVTLPSAGAFLIGRSSECTVQIDDASLSRRHAVLHVDTALAIEDLGSANGTRVRDRQVEPHVRVPIALGEIVALGKTTIVVQQRASMLRQRRVWTHEAFEARLGEECARSERSGQPLAVLSIETPLAPAHTVQQVLADVLRQSDVVAEYGPHVHEVLLPDTRPPRAQEVMHRVQARLRDHDIESRISIANFPHEGRTAHALLGHFDPTPAAGSHGDIVVRDPVVANLHNLVSRVAASDIGVLLLGETGVGKDVFASRVHYASPRAKRPFLQLNCAGLSETMLDSELFGHEKGAFTGALTAKAGLLETADGGTVFLDEIGDMSPATQAKLLRVIEDRKVRRVGGLTEKPIDVRFVAATNRDLEVDVAAGTFRQDLFFRLNGVTLVIPPLRNRVSEIEPLAQLFAARAAAQANMAMPSITPQALELMRSYPWPGNVRELKNVIARAVVLSTNGEIDVSSLPVEKMRSTLATSPSTERHEVRPPQAASVDGIDPALLAELGRRRKRGAEEADYIRRALELTNGNQTQAAKFLGISRRTLINRLEEYGFERPRKDNDDETTS